MFVYILFFLTHFLCVLSFGSGRNDVPGYSYHSELNGWLKLHDQPASWHAARISCHLEGAFMSSARTAEFVLSLDGVPALHSGFHTSSTEGAFTSINGKPAIILYHDGLVALERCEAFHANGTSGTVNCDYLLPYVCFVPASAPEPAPVTASTPIPTTCPLCPTCPTPVPTTCPTPVPTTCPTPDPTTCPTLLPSVESCEDLRYELNETTGHWYKYHTEGKSWNDANRTCVEEGAHLAIINSLAEKNVLVDLHDKFKLKIPT